MPTERERLVENMLDAALAVRTEFVRQHGEGQMARTVLFDEMRAALTVAEAAIRVDFPRWLEEQLRIKLHTVGFDDLVNRQRGRRPLAFLIEQALLNQAAAIRAREDGR